jgi:hypothetical protein
VAHRSDDCLTQPARRPARREAETSSLRAHAPAREVGRISPEGVVSELSVLARPLGLGLQALGTTLRCGRLAWSLAGTADRLAKGAIALGIGLVDLENVGENDDRPRCALHWVSSHESDLWD